MSSERWQHVARIFEEALERPAEEREAFLAERCGDTETRREVRSLLEAEEEADAFLEKSPVVSPVPGEDPAATAPLPADGRMGSYRLLRRIGQGGMSSVFLGVRDDDVFRRRVAVKLIRRGMENPDALRRLRTERQILASLHHPYIAELYDGGATSDGLPYFVMEYVEGHPVDVYCERRQLSVDERIDLFRKICEAVRYAHQNLVVHRDIKPSNILVTSEGVPRLLDFGIAKLLNPELAGSEIEPTATWMRVLTPQYASPEQVRGENVTTASDVYSLGVLLYKLLTGQLPRTLEGRTPGEIERELTEKEPPRPSTAVSRAASGPASGTPGRGTDATQWTRKLRGDLDMIVLKALRGAPQQRYGSAADLAEDLRRYRAGFPVTARQGNVRYRTGKFLRRHWLPMTAAAALVGVVFAFAVTMAVQSAAVARERDEARRERDEKEQVLALVEDVFRLADPGEARGETFTVREALDKSAASIERRLGDQPAVEAALRETIGTIYLNLGLLDEAETHLDSVAALHRELHGGASLEAAGSLSALGAVHREKGRYDQAEELSREAVERVRALAGDGDPALIRPLNNLVTLLCVRGDYEAAEAPSTEVLELVRHHLDDTRPETAEAVNNRAVVLREHGELEEAERMYREGLRITRIVHGGEHPEVANLLNNLAVVLKALGDLDGAEQTHRETLRLRRKLYGDDHSSVAQSLVNLAAALRQKDDHGEAEEAYREAIAILESTRGVRHPLTVQVSITLGALLTESGQAAAAEAWLRDGLASWRPELGDEHAYVAWAQSTLGAALTAQGRHGEAESLLERSLPVLEGRYGADHSRTRTTLERLVELYEAWGRPEQAAVYRRRLAG